MAGPVRTVGRCPRRRHRSAGDLDGCPPVPGTPHCAVLVGAHQRGRHPAAEERPSPLRRLDPVTRWKYRSDHRKRPHVHPVATPSGVVLTRDAPPDHPWHHALWFTIKFVNEENFWEETPPYGVLRHVDDQTVHWIRPDRETVAIVERRSIVEANL